MNKLIDEARKLKDEAIETAQVGLEEYIQGELDALGARYRNHSFRFISGMGAALIEVSPAIKGCNIVGHVPGYYEEYRVFRELLQKNDEIIDTAEEVMDEFNFGVGIIEPTP